MPVFVRAAIRFYLLVIACVWLWYSYEQLARTFVFEIAFARASRLRVLPRAPFTWGALMHTSWTMAAFGTACGALFLTFLSLCALWIAFKPWKEEEPFVRREKG